MSTTLENVRKIPPTVHCYTYAFLDPRYFVSITAEQMAKGLLGKVESRGTYGKLASIDSTLAALHSKILKKDWDSAFTILEALILVNHIEDDWPSIRRVSGDRSTRPEDGSPPRCLAFSQPRDNLEGGGRLGEQMKGIGCSSDYHLVCKAIGARLFQKSVADVASEKARLDAWLACRSQEEWDEFHRMRQEEAEDLDGEDSDEEDEAEPWHSGETSWTNI
ncbi:hypothetical protein B0H11DRAFT_2400961 [Mycena galericulata]|nr:hypothetical protein B0H11DRAFT_2400961 [Mycena galericulata]